MKYTEDDFTNIYEAEANICIRVSGRFMSDSLDELKSDIEDYIENWYIRGSDKHINTNILRAKKIARYNLQTDEEIELK